VNPTRSCTVEFSALPKYPTEVLSVDVKAKRWLRFRMPLVLHGDQISLSLKSVYSTMVFETAVFSLLMDCCSVA
jgi:hypothetical protein